MHLKNSTFLLLLAISTNCFSQENLPADITDVSKATFFSPGISYEKRIGKFQSILGQASMSTAFAVNFSSSMGTTSYISFDPAIDFQYRYYYNNNNRQKKGKRTALNSLNYISPVIGTTFTRNSISTKHYTEINRRHIYQTGLVWGFQRNYKSRFSLDFNTGLGYLFTKATLKDNSGQLVQENVAQFSTIGELNLGFWLNKRK